MEFALFTLAGLALVAVGVFALIQRKKARDFALEVPKEPAWRPPEAQLAKLRETEKFWGFRIESHCRASSRFAGQQFTFEDNPPLPAQGCDSRICQCCLVGLPEQRRYRDRRSGEDRRRSIRIDSSDRRAERPRRKDDLNSWVSYSHL